MKLTAAFVAAALAASIIHALPINADDGHLVLARSDLKLDGSTTLQAAKRGTDTELLTRSERAGEPQHVLLTRDTSERKDSALIQRRKVAGLNANDISIFSKFMMEDYSKLLKKTNALSAKSSQPKSLEEGERLSDITKAKKGGLPFDPLNLGKKAVLVFDPLKVGNKFKSGQQPGSLQALTKAPPLDEKTLKLAEQIKDLLGGSRLWIDDIRRASG